MNHESRERDSLCAPVRVDTLLCFLTTLKLYHSFLSMSSSFSISFITFQHLMTVIRLVNHSMRPSICQIS